MPLEARSTTTASKPTHWDGRILNVQRPSFISRFCNAFQRNRKSAQVGFDFDNSVVEPGLMSRVETEDTVLRRRDRELPAKLASAGGFLRLVSHRQLMLAAG